MNVAVPPALYVAARLVVEPEGVDGDGLGSPIMDSEVSSVSLGLKVGRLGGGATDKKKGDAKADIQKV